MTAQEKKKMFQILGGSFGALLLGTIGCIYALGAQSQTIKQNTKAVETLDLRMEKMHEKTTNRLMRIEDALLEAIKSR